MFVRRCGVWFGFVHGCSCLVQQNPDEIISNSIYLRTIEEVVNVLVTKLLKGAVSRNSAKLGNYKMPVDLRETLK